MKVKNKTQSGFTLVELLVATAIIMVLAGLAVQAYNIHKENAYHAIALGMMQQTRTALAAGKVDSESFPQSAMIVDQRSAGVATNGDANLLVPGLVVPERFHVQVRHDPTCTEPGCIEDSIVCQHCNAKRRVLYVKPYKMPEIILFNAEVDGPC
jgi:prepilin-type N-terminal cleavage/methylation domain-containing protein